MSRDAGLDTLLDLDGSILDQGDGYWIKIVVKLTGEISAERPHGISYSLTLHDHLNQRILGFDNAHAIKPSGNKKYSGRRIEYDHKHKSFNDKGSYYEFVNGFQSIIDLFDAVDVILKEHRGY